MPDYNTKIDRNRISIEDPQGSYNYLLNEANVDPEKAYKVYKDLSREYAIRKPIIDMKNKMFEENPEYKNQILIKGAIDSGQDINDNLGVDFNDKNSQKLLNEYGKLIDGLYVGGNLIYTTEHKNVYDKLLNDISNTNNDLYQNIKYGKDKNGRYYIGLDKENRRFTKQFFDFCDKPIEGFDKTKGRYGRYISDDNSLSGTNGQVQVSSQDKPLFRLLFGSADVPISSGVFNKFYNKLNENISKNTTAGDKEIYTEMYNMGGQNPYQIDLYSMRANASTSTEYTYYNHLIDAEEEKYNTLFKSVPNLMELDIKTYNSENNTYETPDDIDKLKMMNKLQDYINKGKKVEVNTLYDSFNGQFIPQISFTWDNGKTGDKKEETTYKFTGDFIHNDSYDTYNNDNMFEFAAMADVRKIEDTGNNINVGFFYNDKDQIRTMQLVYAGLNGNDKYYDIMVNGKRRLDTLLTAKEAAQLRENYNKLMYISRNISAYNEKQLEYIIKSASEDYKKIIYDKGLQDDNYEFIVKCILNL